MEIANLIFTAINAVAMVVSAAAAIAALKAKKDLQEQINNMNGTNNAQSSGTVTVNSQGNNNGLVAGVNTGDVRK